MNRRYGRVNDYYKQLEGWTVKKFLGEDKDGFPQFVLKKPYQKDLLIEVSQDPEGNGGGFLFISDLKKGDK